MSETEPVGGPVEKGCPVGPRPVSGAATADWIDEEPIPVRYWWFKRIGLAVIVFVLILAGLRWWWGWDAHRRLQAEIDRIIAAGEPIYPQDFDPPELVPDAENAAKFLEDAEIALSLTPEEDKLTHEALGDPEVFRERLDELRAIVDKNATALDLVRRARARTRVDWGIRIRTPAIGALLPNLSGQRNLSRLLAVTAGVRHAGGDDAAAIETLRDMLAQARAVDTAPTFISHLLGIAMGAVSSRCTETLAPVVTIIGETTDGPTDGSPAIRAQVTALISEFLNESDTQRCFVRAMQSERMGQLDSAVTIARGRWRPVGSPIVSTRSPSGLMHAGLAFAKRPLYDLDAIFGLAWMTRYIDAARAPNWPAAVAVGPVVPVSVGSWERTLHPVSSITIRSVDRSVVLHFRALAMRRMAAIALAIRMYEVDRGRRPASLAELVPEYVPQVPLDPFASDGRPISYRPDADPPVLYSIGMDGVDDGGVFTFTHYGDIDYEKLDLPFFLDGHRPQKPGS